MLCSLEKLLDIKHVFPHEKLSVAQLTDLASRTLAIRILLSPWVKSRLLQALGIIGVAAEFTEVHLVRLSELIVTRWAFLDAILLVDGATSRENLLIMIILAVIVSNLKVGTFVGEVTLKFFEHRLRVVSFFHKLCSFE